MRIAVSQRPLAEHREIVRCQHPTKIKPTGITEAIMENGGVNFAMANAPDTVVLQFATLVLTGEGTLDEDEYNIEPVVRPPLSPRKPKSKLGPKRQATAELSRKFPPATQTPAKMTLSSCWAHSLLATRLGG